MLCWGHSPAWSTTRPSNRRGASSGGASCCTQEQRSPRVIARLPSPLASRLAVSSEEMPSRVTSARVEEQASWLTSPGKEPGPETMSSTAVPTTQIEQAEEEAEEETCATPCQEKYHITSAETLKSMTWECSSSITEARNALDNTSFYEMACGSLAHSVTPPHSVLLSVL